MGNEFYNNLQGDYGMNSELLNILRINKIMGIKTNYSALGKKFRKDRHTIKKMFEGKDPKIRKKKKSELDDYVDLISILLSDAAISVKAAYWYLVNEKKIKCSYNNFKIYVRKYSLRNKTIKAVHPLYETDYGDMVQVDWVEGIKLKTINNNLIVFNLFSATLGASRYHYFEYTIGKTETDFKRCFIHYLKHIGGLPKRILTDNMSAIVNVIDDQKGIHSSMIQFCKDLDIKLQLCKVRTPETKGKDEVSNKFAQWLNVYNERLRDTEHLLEIINKLNEDINKQVNTRTNYPPILLFKVEQNYLRPLPNLKLLDSYDETLFLTKVSSTSLIYVNGNYYSVPPMFVGKTVNYKIEGCELFIYFNKELISTHHIENNKQRINYREEDYSNCLLGKFKNEDELEKTVNDNLKRFKNIGA